MIRLVDKINNSMLDDYIDHNALEVIDMKAVYFDTDDLDLRKQGSPIGLDGERPRTTVKWDNKVEDGSLTNNLINDERVRYGA